MMVQKPSFLLGYFYSGDFDLNCSSQVPKFMLLSWSLEMWPLGSCA